MDVRDEIIVELFRAFRSVLVDLGAHIPAAVLCVHDTNKGDITHILTEPGDRGVKYRSVLHDIAILEGGKKYKGTHRP